MQKDEIGRLAVTLTASIIEAGPPAARAAVGIGHNAQDNSPPDPRDVFDSMHKHLLNRLSDNHGDADQSRS